ncbi:MAG: PVC-type heme-binding CxxCH protein [Pirellulales bacterium]
MSGICGRFAGGRRVFLLVILVILPGLALAQNPQPPVNVPLGARGELPVGDDGQPLNLDFETGTLQDWTAEGKAFDQQPIKGPIDQKRIYGEGKRSDHTGNFWIGGFEKLQDGPTGTLTSVPFRVTQPFGSFLVGGGTHRETRVELLTADDHQVFFTASGRDQEEMRPVIVDLQAVQGKKIQVRLVDQHTGGWGHLNFDDFRLHAAKPQFPTPRPPPSPELAQLYPHAGLDASAAAKAMTVPTGFQVQVGAAEPAVQQPVALALDDRGRVWIAEAFEYPRRAKEGEGNDRIVIFEDTDLDGTLDKRTVFAEKLNLVSGLEVGFGGVWVGAAPQLLFLPDRDGDDRPDGPAEVVLDGWGFQDTHETLNSFIWGPDGWLYGCHGVFTHSLVGAPGTPEEQRTRINAGYWRFHPIRRQFEVFAEGTSNPWGLDFDARGQAFATACVIPHLFHVIQGARYERQAGSHFNPHTYQDIKTIADHRHYTGNQWNNNDRRSSDTLGGGHAHAGAMVYQGGAWPEPFRGKLFMNNIHGNRINVDILTAAGSGFIGSHAPDFLLTGDQWSQMLYLTYGPDGQVWVIDWYDANQCHRNEPDVHDRSNGRIYRITYDQAAPVSIDLRGKTDEELVGYQSHANQWYVRHARRLLQERAAAGKLSPTARTALEQLAVNGAEERLRLHGLWALHVTGGVNTAVALRTLADPAPHVRAWTIQLASENESAGRPAPTLEAAVLERLQRLAAEDPSPVVRLYLASAAQRLPLAARWSLLESLVSHAEDAEDHNLPLMYWYAAEPLAGLDPQRALAWALSAGARFPQLPEYMIRRIGSGDPAKSLALLVDGLRAARSDELQRTFLRGLSEALKGRTKLPPPAGWSEAYAALAQSTAADIRLGAASLAVTFGDAEAARLLRELAAQGQADAAQRRQALAVLVRAQDAAVVPVLQQLLRDAALRPDALRGLAAFDSTETPAAILAVYADLPPLQQREAIATLASRLTYARTLLDAVEQRKIPAGHLSADLIRQLRDLKDEPLRQQIERVWGTVRESAADRLRQMEQYKQLVQQPGAARAPDPELGRAIFSRTCQQCHTLFGTGGKIGPDLTGSNRANLEYLLSNMVDPSAVMAREYQPVIVTTNGGRVLTGLIKESTDAALTLQTATEVVVIPRADIDEQRQSDKSMMPDDQLKPLSPFEIRSLVSYLASNGQVPQLATPETAKVVFNGQDLTGWRGDAKLWTVEQGEIVGRSPGLKHNQFLVSELAVEDFRLTLEVKLTPDKENSGIQFRSQPQANGEVKGYQADVGAGWWGKLYEELGRGLLWKEPGDAHVQVNGWNRYEIVAVGSQIRTWINGQPCVDLEDPEGARRGVLAFQLHSGGPLEVRYRNIRLELLTSSGGAVSAATIPTSRGGPATGQLAFTKRQLDDRFRSEGVAYGDFNGDGRLDIAAGSVWYAAPDWKPTAILAAPKEFSIRTYSDTFCNWAEDLDGDGRQDLVVVDFPGAPTWWFRNPGKAGGEWARFRITPVTNNESPQYLDVNRDGRRELVCGYSQGHLGFAQPSAAPEAEWKLSSLSGPQAAGTDRFSHGLGVGDINGDGRDDLLVTAGWWEAPERHAGEPWKFHKAGFGEPAAQMYVFDYDGDGDADVLSSSAHRRGIWWHEQVGPDQWSTHEIDASIAQTHALVLADINGDGLPDFVTGKRFYAHNGRDPGEDEPPVLTWYELSRVDGRPRWTPHQIDHDSGVGTQFEVVDMNGDGLLDVIIANKKGVFYFEQTRR